MEYYSILFQAVTDLDPDTPQARRALYDRARRMLDERLRAKSPPLPEAVIGAERASLDAAVARVEAEIAPREPKASRAPPPRRATPRALSNVPPHDDGPPASRRFPVVAVSSVLGAVAVLVIGVVSYPYLTGRSARAPGAETSPGNSIAGDRSTRPAEAEVIDVEELAPGVDGGSTDAGLPFFYRRQPVYYRTIYGVGSLVIDRSQRFLYLVQPKITALRYGIGVGGECRDTAGLHRVSRKQEWPEWVPSPELLKRHSYPPRLAGGPGNPLGARVLYLDSNNIAIHGTNAPKTIGHAVSLGCFRMVNDDVVDLYKRVPTETAVVVMN